MAETPGTAAQARQRQLDALKLKAIDTETDELVEKVAGASIRATIFGRIALVVLGAWLLTRSDRLIGTYGAACLLFDAVLCMVLLDSVCRAALDSATLRYVLAATFALGALVAIPAALANFIGPIGPFRPLSLKGLSLGLFMLAFLAGYGTITAYLTWLFGAHSPDALRTHLLFRKAD